MSKVKVSVLMMAYNQEDYIATAIDGIIFQETDFKYELVIAEDHSTDGTLRICHNYQERYPDKVRVLQRPDNLGMHRNFVDAYAQCRGKYIALCEGDDYWTDPKKLQIQADFLDAHSDFAICFHPAKEISLEGKEIITNQDQKEITDVKDVIRGWYIRTATYMFRKNTIENFPDWYYKVSSTDQCFHILLTQHGGKIKFIERVMSVYRRNKGGVMHNAVADYEKYLRKTINFYQTMAANLPTKELRTIANEKIREKQNALFYSMRNSETKSFSQWMEIVELFFSLGKYRNLRSFLSRKSK